MTSGGLSISLPATKKCRRGGVDTLGLTFLHQAGSELLSQLQAHPDTVPFARGVLLLPTPASGLRVMAWPDAGVVKTEGRLGALLDGSAASYRLAQRQEIVAAPAAARAAFRELGLAEPDGADVVVSRSDLTTELAFDRPADGISFLRAMRALRPPRAVVEGWVQQDGVVRQVAVKAGRRTVFRAYDKGIESGSHRPGERVRLEAQVRPRPAKRRTPEQLATADLTADFGRTLNPFLRGDDVTVTHSAGVVDQLAADVAAERLTMARAERLIGSAELLRRFGRGIYANDRASQRRLQALRDAGIAVDDELPPAAVVPVSELLRQAVAEFSA